MDNKFALTTRLYTSIQPLLALSDHKRPLGFLIVSALSVGLPALIGAWLGDIQTAMLGCLGGLSILYMRQTHIPRRMMTLATCAFGFSLSFALGVVTNFDPLFSAATLTLNVFMVTVICRFYSVPPPGTLFFIVVACLARTLPFDLSLAAERTGILMFGAMGGCCLALLYSVYQVYISKTFVDRPTEEIDHNIIVISIESVVISLFVGGGYVLALLLQLDNPYWVPISTIAIMQGATFRAIWHRNVHRIIGTTIGMGIAWVIFSFAPGPWETAFLILGLSFIIELLITRNYGLAVMFITPLTVIFTDTNIPTGETDQLILSRLFDIILGSVIGYIGGWAIHHAKFKQAIEAYLAARSNR
ncbi:FUSC family protein [Amphritea sp. 1_MG-2023]|uniref:FUSC family protein n=1 Tax=Amphritea sp. 1_MG-2023 TaxID=3062670 RepID=UPI0026E3320E|nr:FUSC family protein [Amphritea sp. 1_MG-2023]MDO6563176.1 FUSC family protein [Amphritea sp. 1_MG-2023]